MEGQGRLSTHFQVRVLLIGFTGAEMNDFGREILVLISFDKPQFGLYVLVYGKCTVQFRSSYPLYEQEHRTII